MEPTCNHVSDGRRRCRECGRLYPGHTLSCKTGNKMAQDYQQSLPNKRGKPGRPKEPKHCVMCGGTGRIDAYNNCSHCRPEEPKVGQERVVQTIKADGSVKLMSKKKEKVWREQTQTKIQD